MPANPATADGQSRRGSAKPATGQPGKPGRIRRFFRRLDEGMQLVDAVVAIGAGGLAVRGILHVFRIFD